MRNLKLILVGFGVRGKQWLKAVRKIKRIQLVGIVENDDKKFNDCKRALRKGEQFFKSLQCLRTIEFNCIILAKILPGVEVSGYVSAIIVALIISLLNMFVRPLLIFFTLPATIVTFGLFLFVINAIIILLADKLIF